MWLNSDRKEIMWHSCCHCCCGNQAWQCVRQVNFRQNKLFLNSVGKTDWFCLKTNSFALWKYSDQINIHSPHSNSEIGLFKYFGTISISHTSLVNVFFYTFPKWCEGQMRSDFILLFFLLYFFWVAWPSSSASSQRASELSLHFSKHSFIFEMLI